MVAIPRLYMDQPLAGGESLTLDQAGANYLFNVMRLGTGGVVEVFNGRDGAWRAEVVEVGRRRGVLRAAERVAPQRDPPDLWLLFAPVKKSRTDFIVEKATELGVARILPVSTDFTNSARVNRERLRAHAVEAAEQCGGTFVPEVGEMEPLARLLDGWDSRRALWFCDMTEAGGGTMPEVDGGAAAVLVGPEGGLSEGERGRLSAFPFARAMALGPRVLRADTAVVSALTIWQSRCGDWR